MNPSELALIDRRVRGRDLYEALEHLLAELPNDLKISIETHHRITHAMNFWDESDRDEIAMMERKEKE